MRVKILIPGFILVLFCVFSACQTSTESISSSSEDILANQVENLNAQTKVDICHATSSDTNPWVLISISEKAVEKHINKHGDLEPGDPIDDVYELTEECEVREKSEVDGPPLNEEDETTTTDGEGDNCIGDFCL